jgi:hypothetical protein
MTCIDIAYIRQLPSGTRANVLLQRPAILERYATPAIIAPLIQSGLGERRHVLTLTDARSDAMLLH